MELELTLLFLVCFHRRGKETVKLTYDHKVTDEAERERLTNMGVELSVGATRINGTSLPPVCDLRAKCTLAEPSFSASGLAVSRALGDHFMKENQLGLISEPYVSDLIELTDEDTMLIVASDGVRQFPTHP
jgi:protein phosphatase